MPVINTPLLNNFLLVYVQGTCSFNVLAVVSRWAFLPQYSLETIVWNIESKAEKMCITGVDLLYSTKETLSRP